MGRVYFNESSLDVDLGQESLTCTRDFVHRKTRQKLYSCKEELWWNLLSDEDFREHFLSKLSQRNLWDCWLVAAINCLRLHTKYKELIQKSVRKVPDGFEITFPLWAPYLRWKIVKVTNRELYPQISIWAEELMTLDGEDGLKALAIAYGKVSTGKDIFDIRALDEGNVGSYFNTLVYGVSSYSRWRQTYRQDARGEWKFDTKEDAWFITEITRAASMSSHENMMTVTIPIASGGQIDDLLDFRKSENTLKKNHEFSVDSVIRKWWKIQSIILINPWDSHSPFTLSLKEFQRLTLSYTFWAYDPRVFGLTHTKDTDIWKREKWKSATENITELSLDQIIQKYQSSLLRDRILTRAWWDTVMRFMKGRYSIDSWWRIDASLWKWFTQGLFEHSIKQAWGFDSYVEQVKSSQRDYGNGELTSAYMSHILAYSETFREGRLDYTLEFWPHVLNFGKRNPFSDTFQGKKEEVFRYSLYPALFTVFINGLRSLLSEKKWNNSLIDPWYINKNWALCASGSRLIDMISFQKNSQDRELITDWTMFGINQNDNETKIKIIDFLNLLYFSPQKAK